MEYASNQYSQALDRFHCSYAAANRSCFFRSDPICFRGHLAMDRVKRYFSPHRRHERSTSASVAAKFSETKTDFDSTSVSAVCWFHSYGNNPVFRGSYIPGCPIQRTGSSPRFFAAAETSNCFLPVFADCFVFHHLSVSFEFKASISIFPSWWTDQCPWMDCDFIRLFHLCPIFCGALSRFRKAWCLAAFRSLAPGLHDPVTMRNQVRAYPRGGISLCNIIHSPVAQEHSRIIHLEFVEICAIIGNKKGVYSEFVRVCRCKP